MIKFFKRFGKDEDGAVTVDWVVLTAAVIALGGVAYTGISRGTDALSGAVGDSLEDATVAMPYNN
ncbi:Flp family type IVb pilin [Pontibaca methylaminivorans]|uniref:Flp family type IVb pilin n=1 Tax=Pontibaca methylaminivorans TaxID=515897 RepID=UPI002FD8F6C9